MSLSKSIFFAGAFALSFSAVAAQDDLSAMVERAMTCRSADLLMVTKDLQKKMKYSEFKESGDPPMLEFKPRGVTVFGLKAKRILADQYGGQFSVAFDASLDQVKSAMARVVADQKSERDKFTGDLNKSKYFVWMNGKRSNYDMQIQPSNFGGDAEVTCLNSPFG